jgi:hypothetical protein
MDRISSRQDVLLKELHEGRKHVEKLSQKELVKQIEKDVENIREAGDQCNNSAGLNPLRRTIDVLFLLASAFP